MFEIKLWEIFNLPVWGILESHRWYLCECRNQKQNNQEKKLDKVKYYTMLLPISIKAI